TSEQLLHSAKIYFRDTTEFPLLQTTTVSVSDSSGRIHRTKPYSLTTTFQPFRITEKQDRLGQIKADSFIRANKINPDPHPPISQKERMQENNGDHPVQPSSQSEWTLNMHLDTPFWAKLGVSKMSKISVTSAIWTSIPGMIFTILAEEPQKYVLNARLAADRPGLVMAKLTPAKACPPFTMKRQPMPYFPDGLCGIAEFQFGNDLSFQKFAFEG